MRKIFLLLCLLATFAGAAFADDDPCAGESGPGLGLCTAYCEATECDCSYDPDCVVPNASDVGCFNILFSYGFTTGFALACGDVCPCIDPNGWPSSFSFNVWNDLATGPTIATSCTDTGSSVSLIADPPPGTLGPTSVATVSGNSCSMFFSQPVIDESFEFTLTSQQANRCRKLLRDRADDLGLICN